jgi:hypothetical protein
MIGHSSSPFQPRSHFPKEGNEGLIKTERFFMYKKIIIKVSNIQKINKFNMKRGSIWISAVLYIALGVIVITLVLSAGIPLIKKMKDQNIFSQTKKLMYIIDENIRDVVNEGPGSKRYLSPLEINEGILTINPETNNITWTMITTNRLFESNPLSNPKQLTFNEGNLVIWLDETQNEGEYELNLELAYTPVADITLSSESGNPFIGKYNLLIYHTGDYNEEDNTPKISLKLT